MEALFGEAIKGANGPLYVIIFLLLAKDFYERRDGRKEIVQMAALDATIRAMHDTLQQLCNRVDVIAQQVATVAGRLGGRD